MAEQPKRWNHPLILWSRDPRRGQIVTAANGLARRDGVRPGMGMSEALALSRHGLELGASATHLEPLASAELVEYDPQADLETLGSLAVEAQQFSPIVGIEELDRSVWSGRSIHAPQGLFLDVTGLGSHFGGETELARRVVEWLARQYLIGSVAIASSIGAAWALANYANREELIAKLSVFEAPRNSGFESTEANVSSEDHFREWARASSFKVWSREEELRDLPRLSIDALRIEPQTSQLLRRLGIRGVRQLVALPRDGLASRFGPRLIERIDQAYGEQEESIVAYHARPDLRMEFDIEVPTDRRDTIEEVVRRLVAQLAEQLRRRGEGVLRLVCRLDQQGQSSQVLQLSLFRASAEAQYVSALLLGALENQWQVRAPIHRVVVQATMTGPVLWRQLEFLEAEDAVADSQIAPMIDQLSNRLGRKNVVLARLVKDPQPEDSVRWTPMTGFQSNGKMQKTKKKLARRSVVAAEPSPDDPLRRPLSLFPLPHPVSVIAHFPGGFPQHFQAQGEAHRVHRHWGPERIESGWWRGPSHRRDYFRVETVEGVWMWLYRDLRTNQWYLHGTFD